MKNLLSSLTVLTFCLSANAQFMTDINGRPATEINYTDIDGTPYLKDDWSVGVLKSKNGKTHQFQRVRYDAFKDELEYDKAGQFFRLSYELSEFSLGEGTFRNNFPAFENQTPNSFYQVLYDGKTKFLKRIVIRVTTEKQYGTAIEVKRFLKEERHYLFKNEKMIAIKADKKAILSALADKNSILENYAKSQKLKFSKEEDIIKIVEKYDEI